MTADPAWQLVHGDALDVAPRCARCSFKLIYIDPPFFTGEAQKGAQDGEGNSLEFRDCWGGHVEDFTEYLGARISGMRELLTPDGSMLIHLDWRAVHYIKVRCDSIFGASHFQNEIIWSYRSGGGTRKRYGRKHDTILWYSRELTPCFNADEARVPYDARIASKRAHLFHEKGKVSGDVIDIGRPPNHAAEWCGWPTQKPLALLDWFVRVHSCPGDLVGDFFCGSGTSLVSAVRLGRRAFGCDVSPHALDLARGRLDKTSAELEGPTDLFQHAKDGA